MLWQVLGACKNQRRHPDASSGDAAIGDFSGSPRVVNTPGHCSAVEKRRRQV